jgi:hypothetical protein
MKIIAELIGGSHLYGLATPDADFDKSIVFIEDGPEKRSGSGIGVFKKQGEDTFYFELRHYLKYVRQTYPQMMDLFFAQESSFVILSDEFVYLRNNKYKLIDSKRFYKSLCQQIEIQKKLSNGKPAGRFDFLAVDHISAVRSYGFHPKQLCNLFRWTYSGKVFFETDYYPTNLILEHPSFGKFLLDLKTNPTNYKKDQLMELAGLYYDEFVQAFNNRKNNFQFELSFANEVCQKYDLPLLS